MANIDWHISCDEQKKRCILYEDKEEKHPAVEFIANTEENNVEIKPIRSRMMIMEIEGSDGEVLFSEIMKGPARVYMK